MKRLRISVASSVAACLVLGGQALAQGPGLWTGLQPTPPTTTPLTPPERSAISPTGADTAARASSGASVTTGMSVKDNTGALIGEVSALKGGVATIRMGSDTFTVDSDKLGVADGVATINASQSELRKMLPPRK